MGSLMQSASDNLRRRPTPVAAFCQLWRASLRRCSPLTLYTTNRCCFHFSRCGVPDFLFLCNFFLRRPRHCEHFSLPFLVCFPAPPRSFPHSPLSLFTFQTLNIALRSVCSPWFPPSLHLSASVASSVPRGLPTDPLIHSLAPCATTLFQLSCLPFPPTPPYILRVCVCAFVHVCVS